MERRRFEWTVIPTGTEAEMEEHLSGFQTWNLLSSSHVEEMVSFSPARGLDWMLRTFSTFVTDMPAELGGAICKDFSVRMPANIAWPSSITMMMAVLRRTIAHGWLPTVSGFRKLRGALLLWTAI